MKHFKNHKRGFTIIEVMTALVVAALILTPLFHLFNSVIGRSRKISYRLDRVLRGRTFFDKKKDHTKTMEQAIDDPQSIVRYQQVPLDQRSQLSGIEGLEREEVTISWSDLQGEQKEYLVSFVYVQPEEKKEK